MAYYILHLRNLLSVAETAILMEMILNPNISRILYIWDQHTCDWSPFWEDVQFLQENRLAIVKAPWYMANGVVVKLNTLRQVLLANNGPLDPRNIDIIMKTNTGMLYQCICAPY